MVKELTTTLIVGRNSSHCGLCGKPVLPDKTHHIDVSGYAPVPGGGCGARFVNLRLDFRGNGEDRIRSLRPDLPVIGR